MVVRFKHWTERSYNRRIDLYGSIGIKKAVIHPGPYGITLCVENMANEDSSVESLLSLIEAAGGDHLAICLDTGHLNLAQEKDQEHFITLAGVKLMALHIADNDCSGDQHLIPFARGTVDWSQVMTTLHNIGYKGTLNFEIPGDSINCPLSLRNGKLDYVKQVGEHLLTLMDA